MLPRPSLCLNIPKTGTTYTARFFGAADWLHLLSACRLRRLHVPNRAAIEAMNSAKRLGVRYGSLNPALAGHHARYSRIPARLRGYPRLCALRDVQGWYCSQYLYFTRKMKPTLLHRAIRFLVYGRDKTLNPDQRAILLQHKDEFLKRFRTEQAGPESIENVSVPFLVWFNWTIRAPCKLKRWFGIERLPKPVGYLAFRTIVLLFEDPARVLSLPDEAIEAYFASGRYRRDLRADFYLDFDALTDQLCAIMAGELGYDPDILQFLTDRMDRQNVSPVDRKPHVVAALQADGLIGRIRHRERLYERYLLPLATATAGNAPDTGRRPPGGRGSGATAR